MRRIGLAVVLAFSFAFAPLAAEAQQPGKVYRIGFLFQGSPPSSSVPTPLLDGFRHRLRELGWIEGQNLAIESRWAEGNFARLTDLAADLVERKVDVIIAGGAGAMAAKRATSLIPIVFIVAGDAVGQGLVASLARPGGNVTGTSSMDVELTGKRMELLKAAMPSLARVAVLRCPVVDGPPNLLDGPQWREAQAAARTLGMQLQSVEVRKLDDIEGAFAAALQARAQAFVTLGCRIFESNPGRQRVVDFAAQRRLPGMYPFRVSVVAGGLMSYGASELDSWLRTAGLVDKILKGAKPADLPVEQSPKFDFVINLKTAKAIGLTIPQSLLLQATEVIK
jgi:putative ABC transport system substrate-binding protein